MLQLLFFISFTDIEYVLSIIILSNTIPVSIIMIVPVMLLENCETHIFLAVLDHQPCNLLVGLNLQVREAAKLSKPERKKGGSKLKARVDKKAIDGNPVVCSVLTVLSTLVKQEYVTFLCERLLRKMIHDVLMMRNSRFANNREEKGNDAYFYALYWKSNAAVMVKNNIDWCFGVRLVQFRCLDEFRR